jgi:MoxR-like ATPase
MEQLDKLLLGEETAKEATLTGIASGGNVGLVGEPGGGKTTLAGNAYRLIDGLDESHLAVIPPLSDLTARALVGGHMEVKKKVDGVETVEVTTIEPIIHPDTRFIWADEISRVAPHATNAMLGAHESGVVVTTAGVVRLNSLIGGFSTMNPAEGRQGTFPISKATASRHAIGAVLGDGNAAAKEDTVVNILGGWTPSPDEVEPVVTLSDLTAIRNRVEHAIAFPEDVKRATAAYVVAAAQSLEQAGYQEAPHRIAKQVSLNARALAAIRGQESVSEAEARQAVEFVVTARVGMLATRSANDAVEEIVRSILV